MGKIIIVIGVLIVIIGLLMQFTNLNFNWFGRLPGDIRIEKPGFQFSFPVVSCILISIAISAVFWILKKFHLF
ncbi:DUF2905 domain-containing protein [Moheibacter stercoris]|uniref:Membrane-anchored protein n=1 Tax=Moheibacter stercoris TaxID=1628251 RepID=A0ABV2LVK7_9FLAO